MITNSNRRAKDCQQSRGFEQALVFLVCFAGESLSLGGSKPMQRPGTIRRAGPGPRCKNCWRTSAVLCSGNLENRVACLGGTSRSLLGLAGCVVLIRQACTAKAHSRPAQDVRESSLLVSDSSDIKNNCY